MLAEFGHALVWKKLDYTFGPLMALVKLAAVSSLLFFYASHHRASELQKSRHDGRLFAAVLHIVLHFPHLAFPYVCMRVIVVFRYSTLCL